ncbi:MAG: response regulator transcription factor [Chloroflexi bacterium]|nr:response regulator transcription factor [Chloroflexota bacterium]
MYRVIVADDEDIFRQWLCSLLEASGDFQVIGEAGTGSETLRLAGLLLPDAVIADVEMPQQDGLDVARYIKGHLPDIKVILVSSHIGRSYERLAQKEGALAFISKVDLSPAALLQALQQKEER